MSADPFEIRLSGSGGQGLILAGMILAEAVLREGKRAAQSQAFEPVSRGGLSRADLVISLEAVDYPLVTRLDFLLVLDPQGAEESFRLLKPEGIVVVDARQVPKSPAVQARLYALPLIQTAIRLGNIRATNMVALGTLAALTHLCRRDSLAAAIQARSPKGFVDVNLAAMGEGYRLATEAAGVGAK